MSSSDPAPHTGLQRFVALSYLLFCFPYLKELTMPVQSSSDYDLQVRQNPERARVAGGKEKGLWYGSCH